MTSQGQRDNKDRDDFEDLLRERGSISVKCRFFSRPDVWNRRRVLSGVFSLLQAVSRA